MKDCIFCKIAKNEASSNCIYEDEMIKVFMSIDPATNGHLLIIPKKHYVTIMDIDKKIISHSIDIIKKKLYPLLKDKLGAKGVTISQNNDLGQEIKHYHIHVIPRYDNDNADFKYNHENVDDINIIFDKLMS